MVLNQRKKAKKMILTGLVLLFTFSIILAVPPTITTKTTPTTVTLTLPTKTTTTTTKASGDEGEIEWNQTYGGGSDDWGYCVEQTTDGGYIIVGRTESYGGADIDVWLIKTDANGNIFWDRIFGGGLTDWGYCVKQTVDGGYIITGVTESYAVGSYDVWLIKTDENGNLLWDRTFGGGAEERGLCVEQTLDGGYIITGNTLSFGPTADIWLIKTNSTGGHEWNQTYGGIDDDYGEYVEQTSDGGYIITGVTISSGRGWEVWLIKTDASGVEEWKKTYGGFGNEWGLCVEQTLDGGYIITGWTRSFGAGNQNIFGAGNQNIWLIKTNSTGGHEWNQTYGGGTGDDIGYRVEQTVDSGYIITGWTYSYGAGGADVWLIKTDENGNGLLSGIYGGTDDDASFCVEQSTDGGYIIVGYTRSYGGADQDIWLIKVSAGLPVIDHPPNVLYEKGTTGHTITWNPSDNNPASYTVTRDGSVITSESWNGGSITVSVDGLSVGSYTFVCTVYDHYGGSVTDTVIVTVFETTPPTIDHPSDITYEVDTTAHSITWSPSDDNPVSYTVMRDGFLIASETWDGSSITVNIDGLSVGIYAFICTVYDEDDNSVSDTVTVTIIDTTPPTMDDVSDMSYEEDTTGHNITWNPSDVNPDYCIITRDEAVLFSSSWDGSPITVNVDLLPPGTYTYICTVFDEAGNSATDSVKVTVTEEEGLPWLWIGISAIVVIAGIGAVVLYLKKE